MTASQPKEKLQIETGSPVTIALFYAMGKQVPSRIPGAPNQMYYSLVDGRGMYVALEVARMIDELKLKPGEPFTLLKRGPRDWEVKRARELFRPESKNFSPPDAMMNGAGEDVAAILSRCYGQAIGIALGAVEEARSRGLMVTPSFEDLRCISTALMIQEAGRR